MSPSEKNNEHESLKETKKTYESPAWEVEEVFEKTALGCAKADSSCGAGPIQS